MKIGDQIQSHGFQVGPGPGSPQAGPSSSSGWGKWLPVVGGLLGAAGAVWSSHQSAKQAQKDRDFQERMSSTAHQREVADLKAAGLNPILSANRGADTPGGAMGDVKDPAEGMSKGIMAALALRRSQSEISLIDAQTDREHASAQLNRQNVVDLQSTLPRRMTLMQSQEWLAGASGDQIRARLPFLKDEALAEIARNNGAAAASQASALIDRLSVPGAEADAALSRRLGEFGPAAKLVVDAIGKLTPAALGAAWLNKPNLKKRR